MTSHWIMKETKSQIHNTDIKLFFQSLSVEGKDADLMEVRRYTHEDTFQKNNHTFNNKVVIQEYTRNLIKYGNQIKNVLHCTYIIGTPT